MGDKHRAVLIKLGGSVITHKNRPFKADYAALRRIARALARRRERLVLLNGAGSFGHIPVKHHQLDKGFGSNKLEAFSQTKLQLLRLQQILISVLSSHGIPTVPFIPSSFMLAQSGRLCKVDLLPLCKLLDLGLVPLLGGDLVPDLDRGWSVVSADQMASWIAPRIGASMLIYGTDVDGFYSSDPKNSPEARFIETVTYRDVQTVARSALGSRTPDVTSGMRGKLHEAQRAAKRGVAVIIMNLRRPERLHAILDGKKGKWTTVLPPGGV